MAVSRATCPSSRKQVLRKQKKEGILSCQIRKWGACYFWIGALMCWALNTSSFAASSPIVFEFALPELEGAISLGIYDESGKLVRTLTQHAPLSSFQIGFNGLIASWDGKLDNDKQAVSGTYEIRGFVVGTMKVEGREFRFNDWVSGDNGPFPTKILSIFCAPKGGLLVLWTTLEGICQIAYYTNSHSPLWVRSVQEIDSPPSLLSLPLQIVPLLAGTNGEEAFVVFGDRLLSFSLANGSTPRPAISLPFTPTTACIQGQKLLLATSEKIVALTVLGTEWPISIPPPVGKTAGIYAKTKSDLVLSEDGILQEWHKGSWHRIPLPVLAEKVAPSRGDTVWLTARTLSEGEFLGQFNIRGEFLRRVRLPSDESTHCLSAPLDEDKVLVLRSKTNGSYHLIGYKFAKIPNGTNVACQEFLNRTLTPCAQFGLFQSQLIPDDPTATSSIVEFSLPSNALDSQPGKVRLKAKVEGDTAWLTTEDGLPLLPVGKLQAVSRVLILREGESDAVLLYCGNGAVVAEFSVQDVRNLSPIHAGSIHWKQ